MEKFRAKDLKLMRLSLCMKPLIIVWSFYLAVTGDTWEKAVFYLSISIIFIGLLIFQVSKYQRHKQEAIEEHNEL